MRKKIEDRSYLGPILIRKGQDWYFLSFSPTFFNIFVRNFEHSKAMLKTASRNIEKCKRKSKEGPRLVLS